MLQRIRHSFRWAAWSLILFLTVSAVGAGGAWRCSDGRLCPFGGRMPRPSAARVSSVAACPMCVTVEHRTDGPTVRGMSMRCFLAEADNQFLQVQPPVHLAAPALVPIVFVTPTVAESPSCWVPAANANAPPDPGLSLHTGRAPPFTA